MTTSGKSFISKKYQVLMAATGINFLAGLLYIWSIVSKGLSEEYHWSSTQASLPYTVAIISFVIAMAAAGRLQDKKGPRICAVLSGILIGIGLMLSSFTTNPILILLTFGIITGSGIGISSIATMPPALKWFPSHRKGLITGVVVGGIAFASVVYSPVAQYLINGFGVSFTFLIIGAGVLVLMLLLSIFLTNPPAGYNANTTYGQQAMHKTAGASQKDRHKNADQQEESQETCSQQMADQQEESQETCSQQMNDQQAAVVKIDYEWHETIRLPKFHKLWIMLGFSSAAGLMVIGHAAGIAKTQVGWNGGFILVILIAVFNALGRLFGGYISDKVGRISYLRWVFAILAINMLLFGFYSSIFLLCLGAAITGICYGSIFAVFPAATADNFGLKHFGANYGLIFTAWGLGGIIGPMTAAAVFDNTGHYSMAYLISCALLIVVFAISLTVKNRNK